MISNTLLENVHLLSEWFILLLIVWLQTSFGKKKLTIRENINVGHFFEIKLLIMTRTTHRFKTIFILLLKYFIVEFFFFFRKINTSNSIERSQHNMLYANVGYECKSRIKTAFGQSRKPLIIIRIYIVIVVLLIIIACITIQCVQYTRRNKQSSRNSCRGDNNS